MAEYGWTGKILRVNLTTGNTSLTPTTDYVPKYVGGRGVADKIYWDEIPVGVGAFDAENKLIFMTGPAAGALGPQSGRVHLVGKTPVKELRPYPGADYPNYDRYWGSNGGGYVAAEMKRAGYDGIIVEGKSGNPVYIYIKDDKVEIRGAASLVGLTVNDKQRAVYEACNNDAVMLAIGPAGEKLVREAVITSSVTDTLGSGGFGAVMGSKNLLAIAIKGTGGVKVADAERMIETFYKWSRAMSRKETEMVPFEAKKFDGKDAHWRGRVFKIRSPNYYQSTDELEGTQIGDKVKQGLAKFKFRSCTDCPVCCRLTVCYDNAETVSGTCKEFQMYNVKEMAYYGAKPFGDATLTHAGLGGNLGLSFEYDPAGVIDRMAQAGVLTPGNSGLPVDKVGSKEYITQFFEKLANREGIGDAIAEGAPQFMKGFSEAGEDLYKSTYETKKKPVEAQKANQLLSLTGFRDHGQFWWNLARAGRKSLHGLVSGSEEEKAVMIATGKTWFGSELAMDDSTWEYKSSTVRQFIYRLLMVDSLPACIWGSPAWYNLYTADHVGEPGTMANTFSAATGVETSDADMLKMGERIWNLERAIAVREGRTRADDWGWTDDEGNIAQALKDSLDNYYEESGWDETTGWPTRAKLEELGLGDIADELEGIGKLP